MSNNPAIGAIEAQIRELADETEVLHDRINKYVVRRSLLLQRIGRLNQAKEFALLGLDTINIQTGKGEQ